MVGPELGPGAALAWRGPRGWSLLGIFVILTALAFPISETIVFGRQARHEGVDVFDCELPRLGVVHREWAQNGPSLWSPHLTAGNTRFAQFMGTPLALDEMLVPWLSPFSVYLFRYSLVVLASGVSIYVFLLKSVQLPVGASLAGALIYLFSFWHYNHGFSAALLPLVLWMSDEAQARSGRRMGLLAATGLLAGFLFYNANSQATLWTAGLHLIYGLALADGARERASRVRFWLAVWSIGLALYAPVVFTQLQMLPESVRSIRNDRVWIPNLGAALGTFIEQYATMLLSLPVARSLGLKGPIESSYGTWYGGVIAALVFALAIGLPRLSRREKAAALMLGAIPAIDLLATTLLFSVQEHLGPLRSFQFVRIRLFVPFAVAFSVAVAVACFERAVAGGTDWLNRRRRLLTGMSLMFLTQGLLCARTLVYLAHRHVTAGSAVVPWTKLTTWTVASLYFGVAALAAFGLRFWAVGRPRGAPASTRFPTSPLKAVTLVLLTAIALDRVLYARLERWVNEGRLASFAEGLAESSAIHYLTAQANPEGYRILTVANYAFPHRSDNPNRLMYHGLLCADGYENLYPLRYHDFFGLVTKPHLDRDPVAARSFHAWGERAYAWGPEINLALASLASVRWICAQQVTVDDTRLKVVFRAGDEIVYENPLAFPRAFLVPRVRSFDTRATLLDALSKARTHDLRAAAYVLGDEAGPGVQSPTLEANTAEGSARLRAISNDHLAVDVDAPSNEVLVLTDVVAPGWIARVDGRPTQIFSTYNAFRGVRVPAGRSLVDFSYRPATTYAGFKVSLAALGVVAGVGLAGLRRRTIP